MSKFTTGASWRIWTVSIWLEIRVLSQEERMHLVRLEGIEPPTSGLEGLCKFHLQTYWKHILGIRTLTLSRPYRSQPPGCLFAPCYAFLVSHRRVELLFPEWKSSVLTGRRMRYCWGDQRGTIPHLLIHSQKCRTSTLWSPLNFGDVYRNRTESLMLCRQAYEPLYHHIGWKYRNRTDITF